VTRKDIIRVISEELGLTQFQTSQIVHNLFDAIVNAVAKNGRVELRNFGVFEVRCRKARQGRNPRTGEKVMVPAKCTVTFKPGRALEERVESASRGATTSRNTRCQAKSSLGVGTARSGD
jgi:DNA-binding protein HU-beta/integration host factor subunit beta